MDKKLVILLAVLLISGIGGAAYYLSRTESGEPELVKFRADEDGAPESGPVARRAPKPAANVAGSVSPSAPRKEGAPIAAKDPFGQPLAGVFGLVRDAAGAPVAGARVAVHDDASPSASFGLALPGRVRAETVSGADGAYKIDDLPTYETFLLSAKADGFIRATIAPLPLAAGRRIELPIVLSKGVAVSGTVADENGRPLAGAVIVERHAREASMDTLHSALSEARSGADGAFVLEHVTPGLKTFDAALPGYARGILADVEIRANDAARPLTFVLLRGKAIKGKVIGDDQKPIADAEIAANPVLYEAAGVKLRNVTATAADGTFTLDGVADGSYVVTATIPGTSFITRANAVAGQEDVVLTLSLGTRVRGTVIDDETGAPVRAFSLITSPTAQLMARPKERTKNVVSPEGTFDLPLSFITPTTRSVFLFALAPGYAGGSAEVRLMEKDGPPTPQVKLVEGVVIRIRKGAHVTGRVMDAGGFAIEGARLTLVEAPDEGADPVMHRLAAMLTRSNQPNSGGAAAARGHSGADGRFDFPGPLPGRYFLRIEHDDYAPFQTKDAFTVPESGSFDTGTHNLVRGGRVRGVVRNRQKEPEEGSRVVLAPTDMAGGDSRQILTGVMGEFDFEHVVPGVYLLTVSERRGVATALSNLFRGQPANTDQLTITVAEGETVVQDL